MTETDENIPRDELGWEDAEVEEGRQPGAVVSVRLAPDEVARLRRLADSAGVTVSQIVRRALADFEDKTGKSREHKVFVAAFTYGGTMPVAYEHVSQWRGNVQAQLTDDDETRGGAEAVTTTEPTRVSERVTLAS